MKIIVKEVIYSHTFEVDGDKDNPSDREKAIDKVNECLNNGQVEMDEQSGEFIIFDEDYNEL